MRVRLWPTGVKYIDIGSRHEFLARKAMLIDVLSMAGEKSGSRSKKNDVLNLAASAHSLITTKGQHGQTTWNLKFARRMVPSVDLLWVSSSPASSEWRDALASGVMRKLVETKAVDVALGYAAGSSRGWLMGYKALFTGYSILGSLSWTYVYSKCIEDHKMIARIAKALGGNSIRWLRELESTIRDAMPESGEIVTTRFRLRRKLEKALETSAETNGTANGISKLMRALGVNWQEWRNS